jgi:hypothetical protein
VPTTLALRRKSRERLAWILAAACAAAAVAGLGWALRLRGVARDAERPFVSEVVPPPDVRLAGLVQGAMALSPDGRRLVFVVAEAGQPSLAVRDLSSGETKALAGTDGAGFPFWSPDSRSVAFFADKRLKKVEATGGPVQVVCDANAGRGGSWGVDGTRIAVSASTVGGGGASNLWIQATSGSGSQQPLLEKTSVSDHRQSRWLDYVNRPRRLSQLAAHERLG